MATFSGCKFMDRDVHVTHLEHPKVPYTRTRHELPGSTAAAT